MRLEYLNPKIIKSYKRELRNNYKTISNLIDSIEDFGFINPILLTPDYTVVCGEARLMAALKLNLEKIPCVIVDELTEDQVKGYRLIDNQLQELSLWNYENKNKEIEEIDMNLAMYGLPEEYHSYINIDDFFEKENINQISLFDGIEL